MVVSGPEESKDGVAGSSQLKNGHVNSVLSQDSLVAVTPISSKGISINIYDSCVRGICTCKYVLGDNETQLKPCRFASLIFVDRVPSSDEILVFESVLHGVDIVSSEVQGYECQNYKSILNTENKPKMDEIIRNELQNGYL